MTTDKQITWKTIRQGMEYHGYVAKEHKFIITHHNYDYAVLRGPAMNGAAREDTVADCKRVAEHLLLVWAGRA